MKIKQITDFLEGIAPLSLQEDYDNAGLLIGDAEMDIKGALCTLDSTEAVLEEALAIDCNLIIAHHPVIFTGIKKFYDYYVHRVVKKAIKNDLAIYVIHTNLDNVLINGVNERIAQRLQLSNLKILKPKQEQSANRHNIGSGIVGTLGKPMDELAFFDVIKDKMNCKVIRHTLLLGNKISKVACCGGSGSFLLKDAIASGAEIFISSDFKYHEFFDADGRIVIADIGHYETEHFTQKLLAHLISNKFPNFAAHCSKVDTNPVFYH